MREAWAAHLAARDVRRDVPGRVGITQKPGPAEREDVELQEVARGDDDGASGAGRHVERNAGRANHRRQVVVGSVAAPGSGVGGIWQAGG